MADSHSTPSEPRRPSPITRWLSILLLLVAGALVWTVINTRAASRTSTVESTPRTITPRGDLSGDEQSTIELFEQTAPAVVHITSLAMRRSRLSMNIFQIPQGTGSGFLWDDQGHVVTNYHVVEERENAKIVLHDNSVWRAKVIGKAPHKDLAVLKIEAPAEMLKTLPLGTSANLQVGQKVFAIGNPFGLDQSLTTGIISGLGREIRSQTGRPIQGVIQTDAAINPGNSGGPLIDSAGRLIGVNTAIASNSGDFSGIGFAMPVDTVNRIVPQLISHGQVVGAGLGINIATDQLAKRYSIDGVIVLNVPPDSAAGRVGLEGMVPGPSGWQLRDVIVGIDDVPVHTAADLFRVLDRHKVGDAVTLEVARLADKRKVTVTLQALPPESADSD